MDVAANSLFRRITDDAVHHRLGKRPLDVGADRIARTASWALGFIEEVRQRTGTDWPLAWHCDESAGSAIEVYPAATLEALGILSRGYKGAKNVARRAKIVDALEQHLQIPAQHRRTIVETDHALDALLCALAGWDFVNSLAVAPTVDNDSMRNEGWIWVRKGVDRKD